MQQAVPGSCSHLQHDGWGAVHLPRHVHRVLVEQAAAGGRGNGQAGGKAKANALMTPVACHSLLRRRPSPTTHLVPANTRIRPTIATSLGSGRHVSDIQPLSALALFLACLAPFLPPLSAVELADAFLEPLGAAVESSAGRAPAGEAMKVTLSAHQLAATANQNPPPAHLPHPPPSCPAFVRCHHPAAPPPVRWPGRM